MQPRLPALLQRPVGFGHLGRTDDGDGAVPEGDGRAQGLARLSALLDRGATGISADAWLSADGVVVLDPVGRIGGRLRRRWMAQVAADAIDPAVPRLSDLYQAVGPDRPVSLDVRDPSALDPILAVARSVGAEGQLWLCHPDVATLTSWRPRTSARLLNIADHRGIDGGLERRAAQLEQRNIDGLRLPHGDWTGGRITLLHRFARLALGNGVVHDRETAALLDAGGDGVYTEQIEPMAAILAEFYGTA